ncbi:uncharacterized protein LOC110767363 [Prunus avium]|uniref:Uncharacterized protein LOC110767363 n=1 Tax=Prunus avium TaxID=42229 RepID=A0A6P5THT9_PRUAV|nr:uncharacterized protein LOC110767363 [Prunus avium]
MAADPSPRMLITNKGPCVCYIAWTPRLNGFWKLSFTGHYKYESKTASVGCIMRYHNAVLKAAFAQHVGMVSSFTRAQSTAFSRALEFAKREGVDYLEIEGNHPFVFRIMWGDVTRTSSVIRGLVNKCRCDLRQIRSVRLRHVNMYGNLAANLLARIPLQPQQERSWSGRNKWNSSEGCDRSLDPFLGPMSESSFG